MNNFFLKGVFVTLTLLLSTKTFANEVDKMFYWSNAKGLVKADHCKLEVSRNPKLGFVKPTPHQNLITLDRNQGSSNLNIVSGSLVKIGDVDSVHGSKAAEVVGVNAILAPLEMEAVRGDKGLISINNFEGLSKNFIQINNDYMDVVGGTYWKVYGDDKFIKLNCPEFTYANDYFVFNVYPANGGSITARVGVSSTETELFKDIKTFEDSKVYNKFIETVNDESNSLNEINSLPEVNSILVIPKISLEKSDVPADKDIPVSSDGDIVIQVGVDSIICTEQSSINVRNVDFSQVLFTVKTGERVKIFQGWGANTIEGVVNGKTYLFTKVEFLDRENESQKIGYVVASYVQAKSTCIYHPAYRDSLKPENTTFTGLNDKNCCNFPTLKKVTTSFNEGMRRFGGSRDGGKRAHAAVDLYRFKDEPFFSVAPGVVIRGLYFFYQDTFALEVLHSGGFVVRYGELTGKIPNNTSIGNQVKMGDRLGYIGKVNSGCCEPMLHFELYSGKLKGPLSQAGAEVNGVAYGRRRDLINPTYYMTKWQDAKF